MDLRSALHNELMNLVRTKSEQQQQQDSMSSLDSSDTDSLQLMKRLRIEECPGKVHSPHIQLQRPNFSVSNKFTDLISATECHVEKLETCIREQYDPDSAHSNSQSPKLAEDAYELDNNSCSSIDSLNNNQKSNCKGLGPTVADGDG